MQYTTIEQSKRLVELGLDLNTADLYYDEWGEIHLGIADQNESNKYAWSLSILLNILPNNISTGKDLCDKYEIRIRKYEGGENTTLYQIAYGNDRGLSGSWHDMINTGEKENIVDAVFEMLVWLIKNELFDETKLRNYRAK